MSDEKFDWRNSSITNGLQGLEEPQPEYKRLAETRQCPLDGVTNVFRYEDIVRINRHPTVLGQGGSGILMGGARPFIPNDIDGPEHAQWRRVLDPMFSPKVMAALEAPIRALANELIDEFVDKGEVEAYQKFCVPLPTITFLRLLGAPVEDLPLFQEVKDKAIRPEGSTAAEMAANAQEAGKRMIAYFANLLDERRAATESVPDDFITALMTAEVNGRAITDEELIDIIFVLMLAGIDTTGATMSLILSWLARHPEQRQRLIDDPSMTADAIEEIMRVETPVPAVNRHATEDIDLGDGFVVKAGEAMHVLLSSANVDPAQYEDPLTVDFDRKRHTHLVFASGVHRCLGSHFARIQLRAAIEEFHRRIPEYWITEGDQAQYNNVVIRTAMYLPLSFRKAEVA